MKKIILILFLIFAGNIYAQIDQSALDTNIWRPLPSGSDGKFRSAYNIVPYMGEDSGKVILSFMIPIAPEGITWTQDTLKMLDSIKTYEPNGRYQFFKVTVTDTGATVIDSLIAEVQTVSGRWVRIAMRSLRTFTDVDVMVGAGTSRKYLILEPYIKKIRFRRINTVDISGRSTWIEPEAN